MVNHFSFLKKFVKEHRIASGFLALVLVFIGYSVFKIIEPSKAGASYLLTQVERGDLITTVSGAGQVSSVNEVELKAQTASQVLAVLVEKDQEVKKGQALLYLDSSQQERALSETQIAYDEAKSDLDDLLAPAKEADLLTAKSALTQAEIALNQAQRTESAIEETAQEDLDKAYNQSYSEASSGFTKLSVYIQDLQDSLGTEASEQDYVADYQLILGRESAFIKDFVNDYEEAKKSYDEALLLFQQTKQQSDRDALNNLFLKTIVAAEDVFRAQDSGRHMYDAILANDYENYSIAKTIDQMKPKLESDLLACSALLTSLENNKDAVKEATETLPDKILQAELDLKKAKANFLQKQEALYDLKAGATQAQIQSQKNLLLQKEQALNEAKDNLASCSLTADFSGIMAEIGVEKGDEVKANDALAVVISQEKMAEISLNEVEVSQVKVGQKATILFDALEDLTMTGRVVEIDTLGEVNQGVVSYNVKILFDMNDERIKPGMTVSVNIITEAKQNVLLIPNSAVKTSNNLTYVEEIDGLVSSGALSASAASAVSSQKPLQQKQIETGSSNDSYTEVLSGLEEGEIIVERAATNTSNSSSNNSTNRTFRSGGAVMFSR